MRPYHVEINTYARVFKELDTAHSGTYTSSWHDTLEQAESQIFKTTRRLDRNIMAYTATISENGNNIAFWTDDLNKANKT